VGSWAVPAAYLLGIGWYFATCIILGVALGRWADDATGLSPLFTLLGAISGLALALYGGIRMLLDFLRRFGGD
jgi:prolipoprotein diacylglyceryltransferase